MPLHSSGDLNIVGFAGSLRTGSHNRAALRAAAENAPTGVEIMLLDVSEIPFFDADVEKTGDPSSVIGLKDAVRAADGLVLFTPEYNGSVSAVMKNAIDWLSRRTGKFGSPMAGKPVAVAGVSPGGRQARKAREDLARIVGYMTDSLFEETLGIGDATGKFEEQDGKNRLTDAAATSELVSWLERFRNHVNGLKADHDVA